MERRTCDVFTAITDPQRRAMLTLLQQDDQSVHTLATALDLKRPQVAAHLQILCAADLVAIRKSGKDRLYSLQLAGLNPLYDWLQHCTVAHMGD
jgi:DNA-binding transcriptional ArsR family regulator